MARNEAKADKTFRYFLIIGALAMAILAAIAIPQIKDFGTIFIDCSHTDSKGSA